MRRGNVSLSAQVRLEKLYESDGIIVKDRGSVRGKGKFLAWSDRSWQSIRANVCVRRGKWYYEARVHGNSIVHIGWCTKKFRHNERTGVGDCAYSWAYDGSRMGKWHRGQRQEYGGQSKWKSKDVVGCMLDLDAGVMAFMHNGVPQVLTPHHVSTSLLTPPPPPQESSPAGKRRVALFGHAGNAWCLYPTLIADV